MMTTIQPCSTGVSSSVQARSFRRANPDFT
jgi:hypothetical protein